MFRKERDMRDPVKLYLQSRHFVPVVEFCLHGAGITDVVAGIYAPRVGRRVPELLEVAAVELKLTDVGGVLKQAIRNRLCCDWSYIAMPSHRIEKMRQSTRDVIRESGVGVLSVDVHGVKEVICPARGGCFPRDCTRARTLWRRVRAVTKESVT